MRYLAAVAVFFFSHQCVLAQTRTVTLWMMPLEPAIEDGNAGANISAEVQQFNASRRHVFVANSNPPFDQWLVLHSVELAAPNWSWVKGQTKILDKLESFGALNNLKVHVRFLNWGEALDALQNRNHLASGDQPDLAQIGTTWENCFATNGCLKDANAHAGQPVPFINDLRLLYYWKRFPWQSASPQDAVSMNASDWDSLIDSLKKAPDGSLALPIGLTNNLIHDYLPLVRAGWKKAGKEPHLVKRCLLGQCLDLTSDEAMEVPLMLAKKACGDLPCASPPGAAPVHPPRHLFTFIDADHEEVTRGFMRGEYLAIIEPVHFIQRWRAEFNQTVHDATQGSFSDHAGVAIPPATFLGGSSLVVLATTRQQQADAQNLQLIMTTDNDYTEALARLGHLPEAVPQHGATLLAETMGTDADGIPIVTAINQAFPDPRPKGPDEIAKWAMEMEAPSSLEAMQQVWRRMGDPKPDLGTIRTAAADAERTVNVRVSPSFDIWENSFGLWANLKKAPFLVAAFAALTCILSFTMAALHIGKLKPYLKALCKNWKKGIGGPFIAACGLAVTWISTAFQLPPEFARILSVVCLIFAVVLVFWTQFEAWKELCVAATHVDS